jgi:hypothetical protein
LCDGYIRLAMPRSTAKSRPAPSQSDLDLQTLSDLLEDTVLLAAEEGAAQACESFTEYISAALPPEMLLQLAELSGGISEDRVEGEESASGDAASWFLQEIWTERYSPKATQDDEDASYGDDVPNECQVCERCVKLTRHHLFPREMHKFCIKRNVAAAEELERRVLHCCRLCHNAIHRFFSNEDLALRCSTFPILHAVFVTFCSNFNPSCSATTRWNCFFQTRSSSDSPDGTPPNLPARTASADDRTLTPASRCGYPVDSRECSVTRLF